jgi:signal transduction histidine kinase
VKMILFLALLLPKTILQPTAPPLVSISSLGINHLAGSQPITIRGIITHTGSQLFVQDSTGGLRLQGDASNARLALGDEVEVTGVSAPERIPSLRVYAIHRLWGGATPLPVALGPDRAADGETNGSLVQVQGRLIRQDVSGSGDLQLILQGESQTFAATLPLVDAPSSVGLPSWSANEELRVVGVLVLNPDAPALADAPFQLLLRSSEDVEVIRPAPWWNLRHLAWLSALFCVLILLSLLQLQRVRASRLRMLLDERARIARDIHDTLAQGFAGITLQLESAELLLQHDHELAADALRTALQMVRRSRDDSHVAIRVLRSLSRNETLPSLFQMGTADFRSRELTVEHIIEGVPYSTPYEVTNHLFHIGMEAFSNAVQHANATELSLTTRYARGEVTVCVKDNGCGFEASQVDGPAEGHFGLTGMKERADAIGAVLALSSSRECGTTLEVCVSTKVHRG